MLTKVFESQTEEVTVEWRRLHNEELGGWGGRACGNYGGENSYVQGFGVQTLRQRARLEYPGVDERIIIKWIFKK